MISQEKLSELQGTEGTTDYSSIKKKTTDSPVKTEGENLVVFLLNSLVLHTLLTHTLA